MKSINKRIEALEGRNKFKTDRERALYLKYARLIVKDVKADDIQKPDDYIRLARQHFKPLFQ